MFQKAEEEGRKTPGSTCLWKPIYLYNKKSLEKKAITVAAPGHYVAAPKVAKAGGLARCHNSGIS